MTSLKDISDRVRKGVADIKDEERRREILNSTREMAGAMGKRLSEVKAADMAKALRKRNIQFAVGAGLVVLAILVFNWMSGREDPGRGVKPAEVAQKQLDRARQPEIPATRAGRSYNGVETVEADVSTRSVAVTSAFSGTEIVVFGAIDNSEQQTPEAGIYDVVVVVEGTNAPIIARRKSNVAGIWINTQAVQFASLPSYYAIASTRPIEEIAEGETLTKHEIGFDHVRMAPAGGKLPAGMSQAEFQEFRQAVVRLKQEDGLYVKKDYGVAFIGKALFRTAIDLPANVPVGPLMTTVYLFRDGTLLADYQTQVVLRREGLEAYLHTFAFDYPLAYGIFAVLLAVSAGLIASRIFKRGSH